MVVVRDLAPRLGLPPADVDVLVAMVQHHLLLPDVATRRDLEDPATARGVADAVGSLEVLELLHALTEADSAATGPAAWSSLEGPADRRPGPPGRGAARGRTGARRRRRCRRRRRRSSPRASWPWRRRATRSRSSPPTAPGLLSLSAGVLALHRLDVRAANGVLPRARPRSPSSGSHRGSARCPTGRWSATTCGARSRGRCRCRRSWRRARPPTPVRPRGRGVHRPAGRRRVGDRDDRRGARARRAGRAAPDHRGARRSSAWTSGRRTSPPSAPTSSTPSTSRSSPTRPSASRLVAGPPRRPPLTGGPPTPFA